MNNISLQQASSTQFKFLTSGRGGGPSSNILLRIGIKKAAVFPEPGKKIHNFKMIAYEQ